jgi:hypothetical protein
VAGSAEAVAAAMISQDTKHMKICSVQITDEELYNFLEVLRKEEDFDNGDDEPQWENTVEKKSHIVAYSAKRRDPKDGGATEYLSCTVFENCSTRLLRDFYMDSDFRAEWDKTLVQHRQLQVCHITGTEVGLMIKKFPMMIAREYVLAWRIWEGDEQSYYCVLKACEHPDAPRQPQYKRVDKYVSGWRIRRGLSRVHDSTQSCLYLCLFVQVHLFAVWKKPISLLMSIHVVRPIPRLLLKLVLGEC